MFNAYETRQKVQPILHIISIGGNLKNSIEMARCLASHRPGEVRRDRAEV